MISYVLAFLGALANGTGNTLNRKASRDEPAEVQFRLRMFADLVHRPAWLSAIGLMTASFLLAWAALATGELASVQLVIVLGRPLTLIGGSVLLGVAAGFSYALTAAYTKGMADQFNEGGISAVFFSWEPYACVAAGLVSVWLLPNAYEAGPLTASQPGITLVDPVISTLWGVVVFGERVNQGALLALTALPLIAVAAGAVVLSRSTALRAAAQASEAGAGNGRHQPDLAEADS